MQFIDFLGNPVSEGDIYIHPVASGSSSAHLNVGRIEKIIPIVRVMRGTTGREVWTLEEYKHRQDPTEYRPHGKYIVPPGGDYRDRKFVPDMARAYVVRARRLESKFIGDDYKTDRRWGYRWTGGKPSIIKNVDRLVVVTNLVTDNELATQIAEANAHPPHESR
jgi:hypothetical protein